MIVAAYLYWPVIYLAVYRPLIVPRLPTWDHVPAVLVAAVVGGYMALLLAAGPRRAHRWIALHALGIAVTVEAFSLLVAWVQTPGFATTLATGLDPWEGLVTALHGVLVLGCLEVGRALGRRAPPRRASTQRASSRRNAA